MKKTELNSFKTKQSFSWENKTYFYHDLPTCAKNSGIDLKKIPFSIKILLENLLRHENNHTVTKEDVHAVLNWSASKSSSHEIQFMPARVLMQDFTGVPAIADLAAMRYAAQQAQLDPEKINPLINVDLVIDHSVQVDFFGQKDAFKKNAQLEFERNQERYAFLKWAQQSFKNLRIVPPNTGIVHQVNLEYLASVAFVSPNDWIYPDTLIGTDSHTTMINGLGCLGWGVGGIEAEAAMLGQPCCMLLPDVIGVYVTGKVQPSVTATDIVLTVTEILRKKGVVGKFVEFFGEGLKHLTLADRATIANMAPEYGATVGLFPIDAHTLQYLKLTNRSAQASLVEQYFRRQGLFIEDHADPTSYSDIVTLDLNTVEPSMAGPSRPQDRISLKNAGKSFRKFLATAHKIEHSSVQKWLENNAPTSFSELHPKTPLGLEHGSIVIAAITSCTNTSNPNVLIAAGLLAKNALEKGLQKKPWVKTSLAPGSPVVTDYLKDAGLLEYLEKLQFHVVGYGCTTCIGNSGPLEESIHQDILKENLYVVSVLSGNRNFEGRVHALVKANYLASPPLVVAYALTGNIHTNLEKDPLGYDPNNNPVYLSDIWPTQEEINTFTQKFLTSERFKKNYAQVFLGSSAWQEIAIHKSSLYPFSDRSTYIKKPPFFDMQSIKEPTAKIFQQARVLAFFGDSITTDHISPAGSISQSSDAGQYLLNAKVNQKDFNSYGARRGNHDVMMRGTFGSPRLKNKLVTDKEGPYTFCFENQATETIFQASQHYQNAKKDLIVLAGKEYGTGSSRDWAAKGPKLLGIKAVIAESFERIHRSNLIGMGILPLQFIDPHSAITLKLTGYEIFDTDCNIDQLKPQMHISIIARHPKEKDIPFTVLCRIDTPNELEYYKYNGILGYVFHNYLKQDV